MEKKKIPIGIKVISVLLILPLLATLIMFFITSMSEVMLMLPDSRKIELMQTAQWKKLNITTIGQFDGYFKKTIPPNNSNFVWNILANFFIFGTISLILVIGLCNFKPWSRMGTIIYAYFWIAVAIFRALSGLSVQTSFFLGRFFWIFIYTVILYYLDRPNIKEQFKGDKRL